MDGMKLGLCILSLSVLMILIVSGCVNRAHEEIFVSKLLSNPVYDMDVAVSGEVSALGKLDSPCFMMSSGGETVQVWYDVMINGSTEWPPVDISGVENGDTVIVTGQLRAPEGNETPKNFWAKSIVETVDSGEDTGGSSEQESLETAKQFVIGSPTYQYDGYGIEHVETLQTGCPYCWTFIFEFTSTHAGYGDRSGQVVAQVITDHVAEVRMENGEIKSAVLDDVWDMAEQEEAEQAELANPASVYCEDHGGEVVFYEEVAGTAGYCNISGQLCEEWEYFRSDGTECIPPE